LAVNHRPAIQQEPSPVTTINRGYDTDGGPMSTTRDELLTVDQVLDELGGVSRRTFFRWRELGRAPQCVKLPNGELRIWRSDLRAWLRVLQERTA
jgi:predicted DNA-binding transcriptional regulator AlpA